MIEEIWEESSFAEAAADITARRMARTALAKRFGPLSEDVLAAIQAADETTLENVLGALDLEEARRHLGLS